MQAPESDGPCSLRQYTAQPARQRRSPGAELKKSPPSLEGAAG
jgi:hypothetical protein